MTPAHVLVVEDDADFRWLLTALLHADPDVCVTGEAGDGEAAVALVLQDAPSIVLMNLMMPRVDGLEATRRIKQVAPATKVVVLSALPDEPYRRLAHDSGADVFLNKRDAATALLPAIRGLTEGGN
jgi:NarL family two-component system response regulator LiaR